MGIQTTRINIIVSIDRVFAFGLLIFRSYDVFMMFGYKINKFLKNNSYSKSSNERTAISDKQSRISRKMPIKSSMSPLEKLCEVQQLRGQSYAFINMTLDGPDVIINNKIKEMQASEFAQTAEIWLFLQKEHFRQKFIKEKRLQEERRQEEAGNNVIVRKIDEDIEEEFKEFEISDFVTLTFSEEELVDIIIDNKMEDVAEADTKNERCCAWVLNHCK